MNIDKYESKKISADKKISWSIFLLKYSKNIDVLKNDNIDGRLKILGDKKKSTIDICAYRFDQDLLIEKLFAYFEVIQR